MKLQITHILVALNVLSFTSAFDGIAEEVAYFDKRQEGECTSKFKGYDLTNAREAKWTGSNAGGTPSQEPCQTPGGGSIPSQSCSYSYSGSPPGTSVKCSYGGDGSIIPMCNGAYSFGSCPPKFGKQPSPKSKDQNECFQRSKRVGKVCDGFDNIAANIGRFCPGPTKGAQLAADAILKATGLIKRKYAATPKAKTELEKFKSDFFTVVSASMALGLIVVDAPAIAVVASVVALYEGICNIGTGIGISGGVCSILNSKFNTVEDCAKLPKRSLDSFAFEQLEPARKTIDSRQAPNICTEMLQYLPGELECNLRVENPDCSVTQAEYMEIGLNQTEAEAFPAVCDLVLRMGAPLNRLCALRDAFISAIPFCTEGLYTSPNETIGGDGQGPKNDTIPGGVSPPKNGTNTGGGSGSSGGSGGGGGGAGSGTTNNSGTTKTTSVRLVSPTGQPPQFTGAASQERMAFVGTSTLFLALLVNFLLV